MNKPLPMFLSSSLATSFASLWKSTFASPFVRPLTFSRSFFSAISSILTCFERESCSRLVVLDSPSNRPIRDFISARSISQAFRSRSCLCHSVCRNRITPTRFQYVSHSSSIQCLLTHPEECKLGRQLHPHLHFHHHRPWQSPTARPSSIVRNTGEDIFLSTHVQEMKRKGYSFVRGFVGLALLPKGDRAW